MSLKVSVITINYNHSESLKRTILSVLSQTYPNMEYIVVDGGSTDGSKGVIEMFANHIAHWVSEPDKGIFNAMNKGIKLSSGDYCLFINSGDVLIDNRVIEDAVENGLDRDLVYGNLLFANGEARRKWCPKEELTFDVFFKESIPHPSTFIKRTLFDQVGLYNEAYSIVSDWEFFMLALCRYHCTYKYFDRFISLFYEGGISSDPRNWARMQQERMQVLEQHFPMFIKDYQRFEAAEKENKKIAYFINARSSIKKFLKATGLGS